MALLGRVPDRRERAALDHRPRDVVVARVADEAVHAELERTVAAVETHPAADLVVHGLRHDLGETLETFHPTRRNRIRYHVHHAAHGAAVKNRGGAPQDLDLLRAVRIRSHLVIRADGRHVAHAEPVVQHLHPSPIEAADDGPASSGREPARLDAKLGVQGIAQVGALIAPQIGTAQHGRRLGHLELRPVLERLRGDDDRCEGFFLRGLCRENGLRAQPGEGGRDEGLA